MPAEYVEKKAVQFWTLWAAFLLAALAVKSIWMLRAVWVLFAIGEWRGASKRRYITLPDGRRVLAGDTLSEVSAHVALMSPRGTRWFQSWRAFVGLVEVPAIAAGVFLTWAWGPESPLQYWWLALGPTIGVLGWLYYHFLYMKEKG